MKNSQQKAKTETLERKLEATKSCFIKNEPYFELFRKKIKNLLYGIILEEHAIVKKLGEGAQGETYLVESKQGELEALKVIQNEEDNNEAKYLADLHSHGLKEISSHVVKYSREIEVEVMPKGLLKLIKKKEKRKAILLEYINGKTLNQILNPEEGGLERKIATRASVELLSIIQYMVEMEIRHRDLNFNNIMLDETGKVKVIDLGIAQNLYLTQEKRKNQIEEEYTNPNKYNRRYGGKIDLYTWGLVTYNLFTGQHLFGREISHPKDSEEYNNAIAQAKSKSIDENGELKKEYLDIIMNNEQIPIYFRREIVESLKDIDRYAAWGEGELTLHNIYNALIQDQDNDGKIIHSESVDSIRRLKEERNQWKYNMNTEGTNTLFYKRSRPRPVHEILAESNP